MNRQLLKEFLVKYPTCPVCGEKIRERRTLIEYQPDYEIVDFCCKYGHYEIGLNRTFDLGFPPDDLFVHVISFITSDYDISIYLPEDWMRVSYKEVERELNCNDYNKWMLNHKQILDKLSTLWSLA